VANFNRLVIKFEENKKEPSAFEAVRVEPRAPVPLWPNYVLMIKQLQADREEVSALEAKVAALQQPVAGFLHRCNSGAEGQRSHMYS
jgi:hypothetical protein